MTESKHLSEPWFTLVKLNMKGCEGRLDRGFFHSVREGQTVRFYNTDLGFRRDVCRVVIGKTKYDSFKEMLAAEGVGRCLPGIDSIDEGVSIYRAYYPEAEETAHGVIAFSFD